ncbi:EVE domain-containing protein [Candidatus Marinamargulisbacteria bacterium SCGC AAA071-K20]|nr:EVE domain-containing protein [Candidatus Marinamargulisbacteria bacterium SCGC AAA071-K20]
MQYWLMKTEPTTYSIDDLKREGKTPWEGIRNYQARNFMRDSMVIGDKVLIYHSNAATIGVSGLGEVSSKPYPDFFARDKDSNYFDPKATEEKPIWMMVDISFKSKFNSIVPLQQIKLCPELDGMMLIKKGMRLSIQPVSKEHYDFIVGMSNNC